MKSDVLKKILAVSVVCSLAISIASAQTAPNAEVDPTTGDLILNPGPDQVVIPKPVGTVVDGDLVIGETTIPAPNGQVQGDGSLYLPDSQTTLQVPSLPISMFLKNLYEYPDGEWFFSNIINHYWDGATVGSDGWILWEDWGFIDESKGWFFINTTIGSEEGFWAYSNYLDSWCFFFVGDSGFERLDDGYDLQKGWFYVLTPPSGDNWYFYDQYYSTWGETESWGDNPPKRVFLITNVPNPGPDEWIRLR